MLALQNNFEFNEELCEIEPVPLSVSLDHPQYDRNVEASHNDEDTLSLVDAGLSDDDQEEVQSGSCCNSRGAGQGGHLVFCPVFPCS